MLILAEVEDLLAAAIEALEHTGIDVCLQRLLDDTRIGQFDVAGDRKISRGDVSEQRRENRGEFTNCQRPVFDSEERQHRQ